MFEAVLNKNERKLVRSIARLQLQSLTRILENSQQGVDVQIDCALHEVSYDDVMTETKLSYQKFKEVLKHPEGILKLNDDDLSIVRHLLVNPFFRVKGRRRLFRKLITLERGNWLYPTRACAKN